jgi:hypothetical protein
MALSSLIKGDDWIFKGTVTSQGSALDITGGTAWVTLKDVLGEADADAEFQVKLATIPATDVNGTDAVNGIVYLRAAWDGVLTSPPDSTLVAAGKYFYDFQYKHTDGSITTIDVSQVTVTGQVTKANS